MESNRKESTDEYPVYFYVHLFFVFVGAIIYVVLFFAFKLYYNHPSFIKLEIFSFILLNSIKSFLEISLPSSIMKELIIYTIGIINFYLILSYISKCFKSRKISQNSSSFELNHFCLIIIIFIASTFPYGKVFDISGKYVLSCSTINIILSVILFRYINIKMQNLLDYLKDKKMTNSTIPDIYLPYMKAHYYYTNFSIISNIFCFCILLVICNYSVRILDLFFEWHLISRYLLLFSEESLYCCLIAAGLIFFYSFNKNKLIKGGKKKRKEEGGEEANLAKFSVMDIEIQQDEKTNLSERKIPKDRKKRDTQEEDDEEEKEKGNNIKSNEESESLK